MTDDELHLHPWPDILKRERREMLVEDLLFTTGVTVLVAPSGGGKSTLAMSVALTVATGGFWAGRFVRQRPVWWVAGEGQDDLRPIYEAWMKAHPNSNPPQGGFFEEAVDLSSEAETNKLIALIKGTPPALIVLDALVDMIGDLDDDRSKDMNRFFRNVWRIARANDSSILITHHTPWGEKRERGSTAIRAKADIVANVEKFAPESGTVQLEHHKRRGGAKRKFAFEVKLVAVSDYPQPIPIVTGKVLSEADIVLNVSFDKVVQELELAWNVLGAVPEGLTWTNWLKATKEASGGSLGNSSFSGIVQQLLSTHRVKGGGGRGSVYQVVFEGGSEGRFETSQSLPSSLPSITPHSHPKGVGVMGVMEGGGRSLPDHSRSDGSDAIGSCNEQNGCAGPTDPDEIQRMLAEENIRLKRKAPKAPKA